MKTKTMIIILFLGFIVGCIEAKDDTAINKFSIHLFDPSNQAKRASLGYSLETAWPIL